MCISELCELVEYVIGDYVLGEPWWFMCIGELGELCTWCLLFLVILVHLVILIDDVYFGENNEAWIIYMWFDDDDFLAYTFERMNCICWVN